MRRLIPTGTIEYLGGRPIHWRMRPGPGTPVVFMGGCGVAMDLWVDVGRLLADHWLVAYDRPGLGGTPWGGHLPHLSEERRTLQELLQRLGQPAVLVAHSMAAFHAEALIRDRPDLVAGLVLVDPSAEWLAAPPRRATPRLASVVGRAASIPQIGTVGTVVWHFGTWLQSNLRFHQLHRGRLRHLYADADALAMATAEAVAYYRQAWQLYAARRRRPWPDGLPVRLLSAADGFAAKEQLAAQTRLARMMGAQQVVVDASRHMMMLDRPEVVASAVETVLAQVTDLGDAA